MMLYKIFFSPLSATETELKNGNDRDDLLAGNIFREKQMQMPISAYQSML